MFTRPKHYKHQPLIIFLLTCFLLLFNGTSSLAAENFKITNIQIRSIGYTSATISWFTETDSNSQVSYGANSVEEFESPSSNTYTKDHSITLTSLKPATRYQFRVKSTTQDGLTDQSQILTFTTLSLNFDEGVGNFTQLNATPTPTPIQYAQQNNYQPYYPQGYQNTQPVYMIPPIIYQAPQGTTLGAQNTVVVTPTPITAFTGATTNADITELIKSSIWGGVILLGVIIIMFAVILMQFLKSRKEIETLRAQLLSQQNNQPTKGHNEKNHDYTKQIEPPRKTYSFEVG